MRHHSRMLALIGLAAVLAPAMLSASPSTGPPLSVEELQKAYAANKPSSITELKFAAAEQEGAHFLYAFLQVQDSPSIVDPKVSRPKRYNMWALGTEGQKGGTGPRASTIV
jgi:hypothetical protein